MEPPTSMSWLPVAIVACVACVPVVEATVLGSTLFSHSPISYVSVLSLAAGYLTRKVHYARQIDLPLPWRSGPHAPTGEYDSFARNCWKTFLTMCQLAVLPWQVSVLATTLALQFCLYHLGFGGGAPYGGDTGGGIKVQTPAKLAFVRAFHDKVARASEFIAPYILVDIRNAPILPWMFGLIVYVPLLYVTFLKLHLSRTDGTFSFGLCFLYHVLRMGPFFKNFAHAATLIHKEGHVNRVKGFFKGPLSPMMNHMCEWGLSFFYGHVPENYHVGHNEVHHGHGNDHNDVSSTLYLDRSKPSAFLRYLGDFWEFWTGIAVIEYYFNKTKSEKYVEGKDEKFLFLQLAGMVAFFGSFILHGFLVDFQFAFMYQLLPLFETINYLAAMNYVWHAFVDPDDIDNEYIKSLTILNGHYAVFNEDYHVEHHLRPGVHWSVVEKEFEKRKEQYKANRATVFQESQEFEIFMLVLLHQMDELAKRFVDLEGKMTHEEKKAELLRRMSPVPRPPLPKTHTK